MIDFLRKILLIDILKGLALTFRYTYTKVYTEQYPTVKPKLAERYRGAPRLNTDPETGETLCIACDLCAEACPEDLIVVTSVRDPESKKKVLTEYTFDMSRCMFCGLCQEVCPTNAIELTQDFELAMYNRKGMKWDRARLEKGWDRIDDHQAYK
jgi:NADH-quinone oxidoreductase subunit I